MTDTARTAALWERFSAEMSGWFRSRGVPPDAADDLVQETFLRLHAKGDALEDVDRIGAFVQRVAHNVLVDRRRVRELAGGSVDAAPPAVAADREGEDTERRVAGWLRSFVANLPETNRRALELHELEGLPHAEIAARLDLSVSGVKSRVQRGRAQLRAALLQCCAFQFDRRGGLTDWERRRDSDCSDC